jgi:hypothetical protein
VSKLPFLSRADLQKPPSQPPSWPAPMKGVGTWCETHLPSSFGSYRSFVLPQLPQLDGFICKSSATNPRSGSLRTEDLWHWLRPLTCWTSLGWALRPSAAQAHDLALSFLRLLAQPGLTPASGIHIGGGCPGLTAPIKELNLKRLRKLVQPHGGQLSESN